MEKVHWTWVIWWSCKQPIGCFFFKRMPRKQDAHWKSAGFLIHGWSYHQLRFPNTSYTNYTSLYNNDGIWYAYYQYNMYHQNTPRKPRIHPKMKHQKHSPTPSRWTRETNSTVTQLLKLRVRTWKMDGWFRCVSCWGHRLLSGAQPVQLPGCWNTRWVARWCLLGSVSTQPSLEKTPWMKPMNGIAAGRPLRRSGKSSGEAVAGVKGLGGNWWNQVFLCDMKLTTSLTIWNWHLAGTTLFGISEYLFVFGGALISGRMFSCTFLRFQWFGT